MAASKTITAIKNALKDAPRNAYVAELHLQVIKHYDELKTISGKDFCVAVELPPSYSTEYLKMLKIAPRLISAGLDQRKI